MRIRKWLCILAVLQTCFIAPSLVAQGNAMTGEPYTATLKTTRVQILANGTKITQETIRKEARDSAGRTYRETRQQLPDQANDEIVNVFVFDPTNRTTTIWNSRSKQGSIIHAPAARGSIHSDLAAVPSPPPIAQSPQVNSNPVPQIESLGTQEIGGVVAEGRRVTRVIPVGKQGNDQPITITNEVWDSPEFKFVVRQIQNDPRTGTSTTELTEFQQGEPDPALFQVPEGYKMREQFPEQN
jgi:hypothetical protein